MKRTAPRRSHRMRTGQPQAQTSQDRRIADTERVLIYTRAGGKCEVSGVPVPFEDFDDHHRKLKAHGRNDALSNRLCLHPDAHTAGPQAVHRLGDEAYEAGWLVRSWADPRRVPVKLHDGRLVLLTDDGRYEPARDPSSPGPLATTITPSTEE